ncbi:MAG: hypothetical protein ACXVB0_09340 [Mucilaginibacter sp.]
MKDFEHLISVWQGQPKKEQLSVDDVLKQVKKGVGSMSRKLLWNIAGMLFSLTGIFIVMFFFVFKSFTTYLGISILLVTIIVYALMMIRDYKLINKRDVTINPAEYLESLKEYQKNRATIYGWMYYTYVLLISLGLALYFVEVLSNASVQFKVIAYGLTAAWLLFCTFYLKNRIFKNEEEKLNLIIERLERLQGQFE